MVKLVTICLVIIKLGNISFNDQLEFSNLVTEFHWQKLINVIAPNLPKVCLAPQIFQCKALG